MTQIDPSLVSQTAPHAEGKMPVSLEQYALVLACLDEGAKLLVALRVAGVLASDWPAAEAHYGARIAAAAAGRGRKGGGRGAEADVVAALDRAMHAARNALDRRVIPLSDDVRAWARWLAAWSASTNPMAMLDDSGMTHADVLRLTAKWTARLAGDREIAESFAAEMARPGPAPEVDVEVSEKIATAEQALTEEGESAREPAAAPRPWPSLAAPLPSEPANDAPPEEAPQEPIPETVPAPKVAVPSFAAPTGLAPSQGSVPAAPRPRLAQTAPLPAVKPAETPAAPPLPFNPRAEPAALPSQGRQVQSGLTADVNIAALARQILVFGPPAKTERSASDSASGAPGFTIAQYASFCVDLERYPGDEANIVRRYGLDETRRRALDEAWAKTLLDPEKRAAFEEAKATYKTWLERQIKR